MAKEGNSIYILLVGFVSIIAFLISSTPILGRPLYFIVIALLISFFIIIRFGKTSIIGKNMPLFFVLILFLVLILWYRLIGFSSAAWGNYLTQIFFFIPVISFLLLKYEFSPNQKKMIFWLMSIIAIGNIIDNIYINILYPSLIDNIKFLDEDDELLSNLNFGTSSFHVFTLFFFNTCYFVFLNCKKHNIKRLMALFCIITLIYIIVFSGKGSVVLYLLFSIFFLFLAKRSANNLRFIMLFVFVTSFSLLSFFLFRQEIIDFLISVSPNERAVSRLVALIDEQNDYANVASLKSRENLYLLSLNTWLSDIGSFIWGVGDNRMAVTNASARVGLHSDFLDTLARYGIIGSIFLFYILKRMFAIIINEFDKQYRLQLFVIVSIFVICGLTKKVFSPAPAVAIFLFLPLSSVFVNKTNK